MSPYFSAAKLAWILRHVEGAGELMTEGKLCMGTMDSWLVYCMTKGQVFRTDFSNASRTQLFDINRLIGRMMSAALSGSTGMHYRK